MSLYRKYRPQTFTDIVGQDHVKTILMQAVKMDKVAHAYLFSGPRGTGKTSSARILAKCVNCTDIQSNGEPCAKCSHCGEITVGNFPDLIEIDAASNRGIDEIRILKEKINFLPSKGKKKVYIIDEVHMLTKEAFNALLKTLEEPPAHVSFILATTEAHKIPETIISRCQNFHFKPLTQPQLEKHLQSIAQLEELTLDDGIFTIIARQARGGLRDAISLLDQLRSADSITAESLREEFGLVDESQFEKLWNALQSGAANEALELIDWLYDQGYQLDQVCLNFLYYLRVELRKATETDMNTAHFIVHCLEALELAHERLKKASIPQLPLEVAVIKICGGQQLTGNNSQLTEKKELGTRNQELEKKETTPVTSSQLPVPNKMEKEEQNSELKKENESVDILSFKEKWPNVVEHITTAFLRVSLKNASILSVENGTVKLGISNQFEVDKVSSGESKQLIATTIKSITGWEMSIECELSSSQTSEPQSTISNQQSAMNTKKEEPALDDLKKNVASIFQ